MEIISKNERNSNERIVCSLKEIEKRKIVEHNDLITSVAKMDKTPLKIFELAVSCIDTENLPKDNTIYLSKEELFTFFDVSDNGKHSRFKEAISKMQEQAFFEVREAKNKGFKFRRILPIPTVEWTDYDDKVMIRFNQDIMPYLIELKQNFTQYALSDLIDLNSKYSIILYKWLSMNYNQYEHYSAKGGRRAEQVESYRNPSITVKELRVITDTVKDYPRFDNFETWILKKPIEEINAHTHFNVTYDKIKAGRSIDSIVFHIEKKRTADDNSYKLDDQAYIEDKKQKEETEKDLVFEAMKSKYTQILLENMLLSPYEMTDTALMAGLQAHVYPLYDELKEARGLNGIKTHLSYIASKQEGYSKRNVVKYLKTAIEGYLATIALQDVEQPERANYQKPKKRSLEVVAKDFLPDYQDETSETEKEALRRLEAEIEKKLRGEGLDHE
ncbi:RepB family plasmid replication initiator protein [Lactococcus petauri]|uniref:RepB family plasmid replication initiator protein n=1 Tax=Lactococcus petauri TaxID=1940789 RepID=A0AAJ2J0L4_9LACT|nr:RepB family plasmid replication initiator protein [Lactococcus petauri]MDT2528157.1 RepB family plasmid replication initiator protein [Lactococcus petauri]MDT2542646.1 RepB family plasmid replication initiator protein [Lactococcus petauri]MDT2553006.1 RepB family plasmid replication initiator protein [Lactococcus petauri]MDT2561396.1 RepB family plasmid replication initiator protein [Lactococcus petauri]MDT2569876.1 RepB family plasmid replication initiator protein [Lactococcus petauri]